MLTDDQRETLQAIASSPDPEVRPGDRLRALELLAADEREFDDPLRRLSERELAEDVDAMSAALLGEALAEPRMAERFPKMLAVVSAEVERREADRRGGRDPDGDW